MPTDTTDSRLLAIVLIAVGALVVLPVLFMGFGMMGYGSMMGGTWGHGMWSDGTVPGWVFLAGIVLRLLFLAAVIGGGYLLYRAVTGSEEETDAALEELRAAYARGELTDKEYEKRRERLQNDA
jgi:putative membrane protein